MKISVFHSQINKIPQNCKSEFLKTIKTLNLKDIKQRKQINTLSLFINQYDLFIYYETEKGDFSPSSIIPDFTPYLTYNNQNKCFWNKMINIFHSSTPKSKSHWNNSRPCQKTIGKLGILNDKMISSYIFYHFLLQNAISETDNKYCNISINNNIVFYYEEYPHIYDRITDSPLFSLDAISLPNDWESFMDKHFILFDDTNSKFKNLKTILFI